MSTDITDSKKVQQQLQQAHDDLKAKQATLTRKNVALKEVLGQIEEQKQQVMLRLQSNVNRIVRPMLQIINDKLSQEDRHLMELLESALDDLLDPVANRLEQAHSNLSPREIEVCNMIRRGFSSKQMASILHVSVHTINNQRRSIRKKLAIDGDRTNLENYLKTL